MPDDECLTVDALSSKSEYDDDNVDRPDRHFQEAWKMGYFTLRSSRYWAAGGGATIGHTFEIEDGKQHRLLVEDAPGDHQDSSSDEEIYVHPLVEDAPRVHQSKYQVLDRSIAPSPLKLILSGRSS